MDCDPVDQPELQAWNVAWPRWNSRFRVGGPDYRIDSARWEEGFDLTEADDAYAEAASYADPSDQRVRARVHDPSLYAQAFHFRARARKWGLRY